MAQAEHNANGLVGPDGLRFRTLAEAEAAWRAKRLWKCRVMRRNAYPYYGAESGDGACYEMRGHVGFMGPRGAPLTSTLADHQRWDGFHRWSVGLSDEECAMLNAGAPPAKIRPDEYLGFAYNIVFRPFWVPKWYRSFVRKHVSAKNRLRWYPWAEPLREVQ